MSTRHAILARPTVRFTFPGLAEGEHETARPEIEITYSHRPRRLADCAQLMLIEARLIDGDGLSPSASELREWAEEWLDDEGYDAACQRAEGVSV